MIPALDGQRWESFQCFINCEGQKSPDKTHIWIWAPCGSVILVCASSVKSRKRLAHEYFVYLLHTCWPYSRHHWSRLLGTKWQPSWSSIFNKQDYKPSEKLLCAYFFFIPSLFIGLMLLMVYSNAPLGGYYTPYIFLHGRQVFVDDWSISTVFLSNLYAPSLFLACHKQSRILLSL